MENVEPELLDAALISRAGSFVRGPELSLRPVELGEFEDGVFRDGGTDQLHITGQLPLRLLFPGRQTGLREEVGRRDMPLHFGGTSETGNVI